MTLLDAETFMNGPNQRRFDVYLQGEKVLASFDIFTAAGGANRAVTRTFTTRVDNARLEATFRPVYDNARISAVGIRKVADVFSDSDGVPDWWRLAQFGHPTGLAADASRGGDDPDGDGRTNREEFLADTDPTRTLSNLRVTGTRLSGSDIEVTGPRPTARPTSFSAATTWQPRPGPTWAIPSSATAPRSPAATRARRPAPRRGSTGSWSFAKALSFVS